ncbi:MAG: DUF4174 domain-containing protein [Pseudomonadota bacterium]
MKFIPALVLSLAATFAHATGSDEEEAVLPPLEAWQAEPTRVFDAAAIDIEDFKWSARPIIVFADSPLDPAFQTQMENFEAEMDDVIERDIVIITDTSPDTISDLRRQLRPRGFQMVLIGKDGGVKLRKPFPQDMREISRSVDKMPIRQREIEENRGS